jgi:acetyltransferase
MEMTRLPIGIICQTGVFFSGFHELKLLGKGFDLGNACDVTFTDCLEYFEQDDDTKVVFLHIEGIPHGRKFLQVANRFASRKPLLALKAGKSDHAARAAQSHTGSLVGRDEVWEAALRQAGVIRVGDIDELGDLVRVLLRLPLMGGSRIGIASNSGGVGIMCIDACHQFDLAVAELSPTTVEQMNALSPSWLSVSNPADLWPACMVSKQPLARVLTESIGAMLSDSAVDAVLFVWSPWSESNCADLSQLLARLAEAHPDKPLVCSLHGDYAKAAQNILEATGRLVVFHNPYRAIRALGHLARYSAFRRGF